MISAVHVGKDTRTLPNNIVHKVGVGYINTLPNDMVHEVRMHLIIEILTINNQNNVFCIASLSAPPDGDE